MNKFWSTLSFAMMIAWASFARAEGCSPDFGDKALNWVKNDVERQSRELSRTDYIGRTFNYRIVGYERLHTRLAEMEADLDTIAQQILALDTSKRADVALAVEREQLSERLLTKLYQLAAWLQSVEQQNASLLAPTSLESFRRDGLAAVGRETLIASVRELGESSAKSLGGRYGVYIEVTFDNDGNPQSGHANTTAGMTSTVGVALIKTGDPYAIAAGAVLIIGGAVVDETCRRKWDEQRDRLRDASQLLPSKLITEPEQWATFQTAEKDSIALFADNGKNVGKAIEALASRWKTLFEANAARAGAAEAVLTSAKIESIRTDLEAGLDPAEIRGQVAIAEAAAGIGNINAAIARGRVSVLTSCLDTEGIKAEEDQRDIVRFSRAQFEAFRAQAAFVPLHALLDNSDLLATTAAAEITAEGPTGAGRTCGVASARAAVNTAKILAASKVPEIPREFEEMTQKISSMALRQTGSKTKRTDWRRDAAMFAASPGVSYCVLARQGSVYACGGGGARYGGGFNDSGDPRRDIHGGANDAGFAQDSRRLSTEVDAASANIDRRIRDASKRVTDARTALPVWLASNSGALNRTVAETLKDQQNDGIVELEFRAKAGPLLARVDQHLRDFATSAADLAAVADLVRAVGGADMSLPQLPRSELPPLLPEIIGITAVETAFGAGSSDIEREAMREGWKAEQELSGDTRALELSRALVSEAVRTGQAAGGASIPITRELLRDSASLRFAATGRLARAEISVVKPDGTIAREPLSNIQNLPENALLNVARNFRLDQDYYRTTATALRNTLDAGAPYAGRRGAILDVADGLLGHSQESFIAGDLPQAQAWLEMALGTLDIATRFIPGVDWGRDVYELVSGRDLFTGETLSTFDRVSALIGVVSAGVGNNGLQVFRVIEKLPKIPTDKWDEIYEFARTADADTLDTLRVSEHALERMGSRHISTDDIRKSLDNHKPFWNRERGTYVAVGNELKAEGRVGVAVNIETGVVTTVMHMPKTNAEIIGETISEGRYKGEKRYKDIRLD